MATTTKPAPRFWRMFAGHGARLPKVEILDEDGDLVATTYGNSEVDERNARLIAAAPEMRAALKQASTELDYLAHNVSHLPLATLARRAQIAADMAIPE